jgi:hypothetical protein
MKIGWLLGAISVVCHVCAAQEKAYTHCTKTYFKGTKQISTSICYDADDRWGIAKAYNREGKEILSQQLRKIAGHASTHFSYYPNGAVQKAEHSNAPDAGIQWYRSTTTFSPEGEVTGYWEDGTDDHGHPTLRYTLRHPAQEEKEPPQQIVVPCAVVYVSEAWFINTTRYAVRVTGKYTGSIADKPTILLAPGDTLRGGGFVGAEQFSSPAERTPNPFSLEAVGTRRKPKLRLALTEVLQPSKEVKRYYYKIR